MAVGKLLLAGLDDDGLRRWVDEHGLRSFTPSTIADPSRLRRELAGVRECGVAADHCEYDLDFGSLAASVVSSSGRPVAALAVTVTRAQFEAERDQLAIALQGVTGELNRTAIAA